MSGTCLHWCFGDQSHPWVLFLRSCSHYLRHSHSGRSEHSWLAYPILSASSSDLSVSPPQCWHYRHAHHTQLPMWLLEIDLRSSCSHCKHCADRASSQPLQTWFEMLLCATNKIHQILVVITVIQRNKMQLAAEENTQIHESHFERKFVGFLDKGTKLYVGELGVFLILKIILI